MAIERLDHYSIRTSKLEECRKFYVDVLRFEVGGRPPFKFPGLWLYNNGRAVVHIIGVDQSDPASVAEYLGKRGSEEGSGTGALDHIAFAASGLAEMRERLGRHGIPYHERTVPNMMLHQLFVKDPNGVTLELNYAAAEA